MRRIPATGIVLVFTAAISLYAQSGNSGTVRGTVLDPSGASIKGATATLQNPVSHYVKTATTDEQGKFQFDNIPFNNYHLAVTAPSFQPSEQDLNVRTPIPVDVPVALQVSGGATNITVS